MYGQLYEDWTFIQCIYFAVAACSTAGLQAPSVDLSNNNFQLFYVTVFIIFGVPIYGMVLGQFANLTIEDYLEKKTQDKIHKRMTTAEINFAMHFDKSTGDVIEWPEFVCFSLIRLGICEKDILDEIRNHFEEMDIDSSGYLEKDELAAAMAFDRRDIKRNGALSKASFRLLFSDLIRTQYESTESDDEEDAENRGLFADITALRHLDAPDRVFADTNEDDDDTITRQEFQLFWNFATSQDGVQWFRDNAIPWLEGKVHLPLNSIKDKMVAAKGDSLQKQVNIKNSECLHFLHWSRTSEGQKWLAANQDAFHNGLTPPPQAFLHQHVRDLYADRPVIKVSSDPVSPDEKHDEKQN